MGREVARTPVGERGRGLAYLGGKWKNVLTVAQKVRIQNLKKTTRRALRAELADDVMP